MIRITLAQYNAKCAEIAKALGGTFHTRSTMVSWIYQGDIVLGPGLVVSVRCEKRIGKFSFSGVFPSNVKNEVFFPRTYDKSAYTTISCDCDRTPAAIAKDVQRRFLPAFVNELAVQNQRVADSNFYHATTEKNTARMHEVSGGKRYDRNEISLSSERSDIYGRVKVSGDSISIDLNSLSPAQAEAVLKLVATL